MQELVIFFYVLAAGFLAALVWRAKVKKVRVDYRRELENLMVSRSDYWVNNSNDFMVIMGAKDFESVMSEKGESVFVDVMSKIIRIEAGRIPCSGSKGGGTNRYVEVVMPKEQP